MRYLTDELYKKMQMFPLPVDEEIAIADLIEEGIDLDDFFLQELLAKDDWYVKYTPKRLKDLLFDAQGEIIFTTLTEEIITLAREFRERVEDEWAEANAWVEANRAQVALLADEEMKRFLALDLADSAIRSVKGLDTREVTIELLKGWTHSELVTLRFHNVRESWMGRMHYEDANWWLCDEISIDENGRYQLFALFDNADTIGQLQLVFENISVTIEMLG